MCSGLIEQDTPISDNNYLIWSKNERKTHLQKLSTGV